MSTSPWTMRRPAQPVPAAPHGFDWDDRTDDGGQPPHAGIGTPADGERRPNEMDPHDEATADWHDDYGTADRQDYGAADRHDSGADADPAANHHIIASDEERRGEVMPIGSADADPDADGAARRYPVISSLRVWNEEIRLRDLLRIARRGDYNLSHILIVRAANTAFFWVVTAPVVTVAFCFLHAFAVSLHRTLTIVGLLLITAQALPVIPWLIVTTWSATTWQYVGGFVLLLGFGTAIAAASERQR